MVRRRCPFGQLLQLIPRGYFEQIVSESGADRHNKGFSPLSHLVTMVFAQLGQMNSLRQVCAGMEPHRDLLNSLGVTRLPTKTNLAKTNETRDSGLFEKLFWKTVGHFRSRLAMNLRLPKFRFSRKLFSLDATMISLCRQFSKWAQYGKTKCGIKIHTLLSHEDLLPELAHITVASVADITAAHDLDLPLNSIIAMDRGYNDYDFFRKMTEKDIYFVTRMKKDARYKVLECRNTPVGPYIQSDTVIVLRKEAEKDGYHSHQLRMIKAWIKEQKRSFIFLTNDLEHSAKTIADIYKDRWKIESFFKDLKQNLKIKHFLGNSQNAVEIQVWTALLAMALVRCAKFLSQKGYGFMVMSNLLKSMLFSRQNLLTFLEISRSAWPTVRDG